MVRGWEDTRPRGLHIQSTGCQDQLLKPFKVVLQQEKHKDIGSSTTPLHQQPEPLHKLKVQDTSVERTDANPTAGTAALPLCCLK